ncbi:hypothetical protein ACVXZ4_04250 [Lacisediminihabitans sp. FW035]
MLDVFKDAVDQYNRSMSLETGITASLTSPPDFLIRNSVNYLRHAWTDYDRMVDGYGPGSPVHDDLWKQFIILIARNYPRLRPEAVRQFNFRLATTRRAA